MITREELIEIGVYNKPHGINGEISATFDYDIELVKDIECYVSEINGIYIPFFPDAKRAKTGATLLIKIEGIDNEISAKNLVNRKIYALKSEFTYSIEDEISEDGEFPLDYFIGFTINNDDDNTIGIIEEVDCSTENFLFIVNSNEKQIFIPATDDFIIDINTENKILTMSLPEGILDI